MPLARPAWLRRARRRREEDQQHCAVPRRAARDDARVTSPPPRLAAEGGPVDHVIRGRHRAGIADRVRHHRGEEHQRSGRCHLPLAVHVGLDLAGLDDQQFLVPVRMRGVRRAARIQRRRVVLEFVEGGRRGREHGSPGTLLGRRSGTDSQVNSADFISRPSLVGGRSGFGCSSSATERNGRAERAGLHFSYRFSSCEGRTISMYRYDQPPLSRRLLLFSDSLTRIGWQTAALFELLRALREPIELFSILGLLV